MTRYHTFVSHLPRLIILQTGQSPYGYRVTRYHIVHLIHQDPSFYKTGQSPLHARSSSENHPVQCTVVQENSIRQLSWVFLGEASLCIGEANPHLQDYPRVHHGEAHLHLGEAHLRPGKAKTKIWTSVA